MTKRRRLELETAPKPPENQYTNNGGYWNYQAWKNKLPYNLQIESDDYDLYGAFRSGAQPAIADDGYYHLPSRDPRDGRILKRPNHPTFRQALDEDHKLGYEPVWRNGEVYTVKRNKKANGGKLELETAPKPPEWWRPKADWGDKVRLTDKGLEGQRGDNYYFDEEGNAVNTTTGRKGHIVLDETYVTPASGIITEEEQNKELEKLGYLYHNFGPRGDNWVERNPNTSSTSEESTIAENEMYNGVDRRRSRNNYRTKSYDVPLGNRFVTVRIGDAAQTTIPINALDTIAKYAGRTGSSLSTMYGLAQQETEMGRKPLYNFGKSGFTDKGLGNANYFKAFGSIPQEYLVRDFRYNNDLGSANDMIDIGIPPMYHAFEMFNHGDYNRGDPNHTKDVNDAGQALMNESTGNLNNWWNNEGKRFYNDGLRWRNSVEGIRWRKAHPYKK